MEKKKNNSKRYSKNTVSVYLTNEIKQQLLFVCQLYNMPPSTLCRKVIKRFLNNKNVERMMLEYALKHIQAQNNLTQN